MLFDALRMPEISELPSSATPIDDPFFCLLENDSLITGFKITSEKLLEPYSDKDRSRVRLVINVTVKVHRLTYGNMAMGGD